jgi:hypothetical protein
MRFSTLRTNPTLINPFQGTQIFCGKISQKSNAPDCMNQGSAEFESIVSNIGSGRDVITNLSVSSAHSHLFIAMADGQCMRWTFSANADPCGTVSIEASTDLVFTKTSDIRLGHIHSMHASPYGSFLTMTRSSQPPTYTSSLRLPKAIYIHRCNTDIVVFPIQVAANTAYFIIPWNGCAALELYSTCQRSVSYWRDTLLAIWSLVSQTSLPLEHSFRGLQVSHVALSTLHHFFSSSFQIMFVLLTGCPPSLFPFDGALMCIRRSVPPCCCMYCLVSRPRFRSILYLRALASAGATSSIAQVGHAFFNVLTCEVMFRPSLACQFHCEELFEPARVLAVKMSKASCRVLRLRHTHDVTVCRTMFCLSGWRRPSGVKQR